MSKKNLLGRRLHRKKAWTSGPLSKTDRSVCRFLHSSLLPPLTFRYYHHHCVTTYGKDEINKWSVLIGRAMGTSMSHVISCKARELIISATLLFLRMHGRNFVFAIQKRIRCETRTCGVRLKWFYSELYGPTAVQERKWLVEECLCPSWMFCVVPNFLQCPSSF